MCKLTTINVNKFTQRNCRNCKLYIPISSASEWDGSNYGKDA